MDKSRRLDQAPQRSIKLVFDFACDLSEAQRGMKGRKVVVAKIYRESDGHSGERDEA